MFAHAMRSTNAVTPSSRFSGAFAPVCTLLCPFAPGSICSVFALNLAIVCALMFFCSGASTSLMMLWYGPASAAFACSIVTPGLSRAKRYAQ